MCPCSHDRRRVLGILAAVPLALAGCSRPSDGPEEIRYGREVCARCGMIISDPQFAAEIRGGPDRALAKFDDVGDALHWLEKQAWRQDQLSGFWVMDSVGGKDWLDARQAFYRSGAVSPMGFGFAAVREKGAPAVDYETMRKAVLLRSAASDSRPPRPMPV